MIEELKIIAEMMDGVTDGAVKIAVLYLGLKFIQTPIVAAVVGFFSYKIVSVVFNKEVKVVDVDKIQVD